jgi:hypothetical protein
MDAEDSTPTLWVTGKDLHLGSGQHAAEHMPAHFPCQANRLRAPAPTVYTQLKASATERRYGLFLLPQATSVKNNQFIRHLPELHG